jgi:hypothetical protein
MGGGEGLTLEGKKIKPASSSGPASPVYEVPRRIGDCGGLRVVMIVKSCPVRVKPRRITREGIDIKGAAKVMVERPVRCIAPVQVSVLEP